MSELMVRGRRTVWPVQIGARLNRRIGESGVNRWGRSTSPLWSNHRSRDIAVKDDRTDGEGAR